MTWLKNNWDKLVVLLLGGFVGYFSGVIATNKQISFLSERVKAVETRHNTIYDPKATLVDAHVLDIIRLQTSIMNVRDQQELTDKIMVLHAKQIKIDLDRVRSATITELRQFIEASRTSVQASP